MSFCRLKLWALALMFFSQISFAFDTSDEIIIDNRDTDKTVSDGFWAVATGDWTVSNGEAPYGSDSVYNDSGGSFAWHFALPKAESYHVYARWTFSSLRNESLAYRIFHGKQVSEVRVNQLRSAYAGQWYLLGSYDFDAGNGGYVEIDGIKANADAVKIVRINTDIYRDFDGNLYLDLPESHDFKKLKLTFLDGSWSVTELTTEQWQVLSLSTSGYQFQLIDFDLDGLADVRINTANSPIYLNTVKNADNFTYSISTSVPAMRQSDFQWMPAEIKTGQETRFKWFINHASECYETVPGSTNLIQHSNLGDDGATVYDQAGTYSKKWFCYDRYGNRFPKNATEFLETSLTVSDIVDESKVVDEVIIDNSDIDKTADDGYWAAATGDWTVSNGEAPYGSDSVYNDSGGSFAWHFALPKAESYHVYARWTFSSLRNESLAYRIFHGKQVSEVRVNQLRSAYAGQWYLLGSYDFDAGNGGYVEIDGIKANADAVKIVRINTDIYRDFDGNLYLDLPESHDFKKLKLTFLDGSWSVTELTTEQWQVLSLSTSGYQFQLIDFDLDGLADVRINTANSPIYLNTVKNADNFTYSISTSVPAMRQSDFQWMPAEIKTGQETRFKWFINHASECYETVPGSTNLIQHSNLGDDGATVYDQAGTYSKKWFCNDRYGNRFPSDDSQYLEANLTVGQVSEMEMEVEQFEWLPTILGAGETSALHWQIKNADQCYQTTDGSQPITARGASGQLEETRYSQVGVFTSRWYCLDVYGNRYPQKSDKFLEATREVTEATILEQVIVDDSALDNTTDDKVWAVKTGNWGVSSAKQSYQQQSLYNSEGDSFAWHFTLPSSENYQVYAWWTHSGLRSDNVPYKIHYGEQVTEVRVNQQIESSAGQWVLLGSYVFPAGSDSFVEINGSSGMASADAIRLVRIAPQEAPQVPGTPGIIAPEEVIGNGFSIRWDMADGQYYNVKLEYRLAGSEHWQLAYSGSDSQFIVSSNWAGGNYQVRLSCTSVNCPIPGYITDNITLIEKPSIPVLASSVHFVKTGTSFNLNFNPSPVVDNYQLFVNGEQAKPISAQANPIAIILSTPGDYQYQLNACNAAGCSDLSTISTVTAYLEASAPVGPTTSAPAYAVNRPVVINWPVTLKGQTLEYYYASSANGLTKDSTVEQIVQQAIEITEKTPPTFSESGYGWLFAKTCDLLGVCSDFGAITRIRIIKKASLSPEYFSVSSDGDVVNNSVQAIGVELGELFVLHWSRGEEIAAAGIGYYRLEKDGVFVATIDSTNSELQSRYPDELLHFGQSLDSEGKVSYSIQGCNLTSETHNEMLDCGSKANVVVYAGIPVPVDTPAMISVKNTGSEYLLEWSVVTQASHYIIEHKVDGAWVTLASDIIDNFHTATLAQGPEFRIVTCQQSLCSAAQEVNNVVTGDIQVIRFSADKVNGTDQAQNITDDGHFTLSWQVNGASRVQITSDNGHDYDDLALQGSLAVSTEDLTTFTLTVAGFGEQSMQQVSIIKPVTNSSVVVPRKSAYIQPLFELALQPIERSLLAGINQKNYVADVNGKLYQVSDAGNINWVLQLQGLVANQPVWASDDNGVEYLFFAVSKSADITKTNLGQLCRLTVDGENLSCFELSNNAIASPVLYQQAGEDSSEARLFQVDVNGILYEVEPFASEFVPEGGQVLYREQLLTNQQVIRVLITPQIDYKNNFLIIRSETDEVLAFAVPEAQSLLNQGISLLLKAMPNSLKTLFSDEDNNENANADNDETTPQTHALWSHKLTPGSGGND